MSPYQEAPDTRSIEDLRRENAILQLEKSAMTEKLAELTELAHSRGLLVDLYKAQIGALKEKLQALKTRGKLMLQAHETKKSESSTDVLTSILNKRGFEEAVQSIRETISRLKSEQGPKQKRDVLMFIDVDKFKSINDTYGHKVGDLALQALASKLREMARSTDIVGRLGGDEFAVYFPEATVEEINRRFLTEDSGKPKLEIKFKTPEGQEVSFTTSGGLVSVSGSDSLEGAKAKADAAMYKVKEGGKNSISIAE